MPLQIRRGPTADRLANTPLAGELVYDTTTGSVYVGNGTAPGGLPVTNFSVSDARTATARMFLGDSLSDNTVHSGVTFAYIGNRLQATVAQDLSNYIGQIVASDGFRGNVVGDDSGVIVNSDTHTVYGNFVPQGDIIPDTNVAYDLGNASYRFRDLYLSGSSIYLGNAVITSTGTAVDFPTGSTIGGQPLGINEGDAYNIVVTGNVIGNDSTVLVNTANGSFHGDLTGSVFADDSTILVDGRDGVLRGTLIGNADTATFANTATLASTIALTDTSSSASVHYINFSLAVGGNQVIRADTSLTYQPSTNTLGLGILNATSINSSNITGNIFTTLIDSADSSAITVTPATIFSADITVENELFTGNILPSISEASSLGSFTKKYNKLFLTEDANALWIGNVAIGVSGSTLNLPAGATVGGSPITTSAGSNATTITVGTNGTNADMFVSFFDAQSGPKAIYTDDTFRYNPNTGRFTVDFATINALTGNLTGTVTGNVTGNVSGNAGTVTNGVYTTGDQTIGGSKTFSSSILGNLTGNVTGNITGNVTSSGTSTFTGPVSVSGGFTCTVANFASNTYQAEIPVFSIGQAHAFTDARNIVISRARGTGGVPIIVNNGDDIADLQFTAYGTSAYVVGAQLSVTVEDAAISNTSMKSRMVFSTNTGNGLVDHVTLDSSGVLTVNTFSSGSIQISENNITGVNSNEDIVIDPSGSGTVDFQIVTQTTVGSAGIASPLPVTPSTYFKIKVNGVEYVVPAYAVA